MLPTCSYPPDTRTGHSVEDSVLRQVRPPVALAVQSRTPCQEPVPAREE